MGRLDELDLGQQIQEKEKYKNRLKKYQLQLLHQQRLLMESNRSLIMLFEGPDAAGKGGVIRRVVERLDPRNIRVYSVIKPTPEEYAHHYLWRFWTKLPAKGEIAIFDRSWYGRVLVERVEGFATDQEWKRAYREINEFEKTLVDSGVILCKFYLHITKEEQLFRFKRRESDPYKHWKINEEDWRNREKWDQHNAAAEDMFNKTSTEASSWNLIEANYKWFARVKVIKAVVERLKAEGIEP
jgi:polyphosphate kinase 2 (PPK2 family)